MVKALVLTAIFLLGSSSTAAFSVPDGNSALGNRRDFLSTSVATIVGGTSIAGLVSQPQPSYAVTAKEIITTETGIKYAVTQESPNKKPIAPRKGDIVAIDYTGYLANGQIFDANHAAGKSSALQFTLGTGSVIPGLDDMVSRMEVGQKVQAIIPPELAYGEKGVCLDDGECLIKPGATLVYDILLKKSSIPPP